MIRAGVIGASGYVGGEVVRILVGHREVQVTYLASDTYAGQPLSNAFRSLLGAELPVCEKFESSVAADRTDVLFLAQQNGRAFLFDWKTGRPGDSETEQMQLYTLFAGANWGYGPNAVIARVVRLGNSYPD